MEKVRIILDLEINQDEPSKTHMLIDSDTNAALIADQLRIASCKIIKAISNKVQGEAGLAVCFGKERESYIRKRTSEITIKQLAI